MCYPSPSGRLFSTSSALTRLVAIPQIENGGDYYADAQAAEKEPTVGRQPDQQDKHQRYCDDKTGAASEIASARFWPRIPVHAMIVPLFYWRDNEIRSNTTHLSFLDLNWHELAVFDARLYIRVRRVDEPA